MKIEIFDVELGQCAMIHCPNGKKLMIDAGHKTGTWWPSIHFRGMPIELLIISNFDEDHTSDVPDLMRCCPVNAIRRNTSVSSAALAAMKSAGGMGQGIRHLYNWMRWTESQPGGAPAPINLGDVVTRSYWNRYSTFSDTNNLSVATFVSYGTFTILFPGDLEVAGWKALLVDPNFRADLRRTTVFVASHHGRENGCYPEVFDYLNPMATIISDAGIQHATQETVRWYSYRSTGCKTRDWTERKVFTTRSDGKISIDVASDGRWYIETNSEATGISLSSLLTSAVPMQPAILPPIFSALSAANSTNHSPTAIDLIAQLAKLLDR